MVVGGTYFMLKEISLCVYICMGMCKCIEKVSLKKKNSVPSTLGLVYLICKMGIR